ncbi:MAG: pyruvate kinase [Mangrovicoccus sp.]|nr:pyruvate kinase [Mangrovicoccus sp.]
MIRKRNIKVVATLGPASSDADTIRALYEAGADVFRLNMSHGVHDEIAERHRIIRALEVEMGRPIAILADLQGPKLRCGVFADGKHSLPSGAAFRFDLDPTPGDATRVCLPHKEIFEALEPGARLLVNDGKLSMRVESCGADFAQCVTENAGDISDRKGVNVPDVVLPLAALSEKDRKDLEFVCDLGVDWVALSFVQRPEDVIEARALIGERAAIMVKIEKPSAVKVFDEILECADGIMVARGDLGVEMPIHAVPPIQKRLIRGCRKAAKPVIVATQMLESMIESPVPTRAEVSDVATAIYEGADAIMLSAESAAGQYPAEAVAMMNAVAEEVEGDETYRAIIEASRHVERKTMADAIVHAARELAETADVRAICCYTHSGTTAALVSRERPAVPIIALTPFENTARRLSLSWGMTCAHTGTVERFKMAVVNAARAAREMGLAGIDDQIVVTAGVPFNVSGTTNILRVAPCDESKIFSAEPA